MWFVLTSLLGVFAIADILSFLWNRSTLLLELVVTKRILQCHIHIFSFVFFQLQRLKRSLSFKSVMRSKSMDNFFQRSNGDSRLPSALITTPPPPLSPPPFSESPLAYERSPSHSPSDSPNPSLSSHSPSVSPSLSMTSKTQPKSQAQPVQPVKTHSFQEHVFRRPTSCQRCKHMIQGRSVVPVTSKNIAFVESMQPCWDRCAWS